jgi:hypothetical protein
MVRATSNLRGIELGVLSIGAVIILLQLSQWATDVFVIGSSSDLVISITWLLLELVALVIGIGLTISPYILLGRLSALVPRGEGSLSLQVAALMVSCITVIIAIWLYSYYSDAMNEHPTPISSLIFAVLPGYLFVVAGAVYGVVVLIGQRLEKSHQHRGQPVDG